MFDYWKDQLCLTVGSDIQISPLVLDCYLCQISDTCYSHGYLSLFLYNCQRHYTILPMPHYSFTNTTQHNTWKTTTNQYWNNDIWIAETNYKFSILLFTEENIASNKTLHLQILKTELAGQPYASSWKK